jgi:glycosyltransferase involved in cell wall biosynthesis
MISVVIAAYNEEKSIGATLESLCRQSCREPFEVIVVDNNSTDATTAVARSFSDRLQLRVIPEPIKGRGAARHTGFTAARGEIIFSLDADAVTPPNWLESFVAKFDSPRVVGCTGTCYINDLSPVKNWLFNVGQPASTIVYSWIFGYWMAGFSCAVRAATYRDCGGFDPTLNALEDADLGFKVKKFGTIRLNLAAPVLVSGRRFKDSFLGGAWSYLALFYEYKFKHSQTVYLSDER